MIRRLKPKDRIDFIDYCLRQRNSDFYVTKNNNRLFLNNPKVCEKVYNDIMKRGDLCYVLDDGQIRGLLMIVGYADKAPRKYIKIATDSDKIADNLLRSLNWYFKKEVYLKIKKHSSLCRIAKKYKFYFVGSRGKELLFCKKFNFYKDKKDVRSNHS